jgi:hypothetical protein
MDQAVERRNMAVFATVGDARELAVVTRQLLV